MNAGAASGRVQSVVGYDELAGLSGLGEPVALDEVNDVYVPLAQLLELRIEAARQLSASQGAFLGEAPHAVPFLIALGGSVAVGKSTAARLIVRLLQVAAARLAGRRSSPPTGSCCPTRS